MRMKLFYAGNKKQVEELEATVNEFLNSLPPSVNIFAVNTASTDHGVMSGPRPTSVTITIWYQP